MTVNVDRRDTGELAITLARPRQRNAITVAMYAALADAVESAADDPAVRVITIAGEGDDFTAGNDLHDFLNDMPAPGTTDIPVWRFLRALATNPVPIVAAVHGNVVGIGTTMLFHCDLVVADSASRFVMPFVDLGLVPEAASSLILPRLAGRRRAAKYILLGEPFGAAEAEAFGLVSHVAPAGALAATFDKVVARLLAKPAQAMRQTQALLRREDSAEILDRIELENGHFGERLASDEVKQAIASFFAAKAKASA